MEEASRRGYGVKRSQLTCRRVFMEKRMGQEVPADSLGDEWTGYVLRITGGNDKQVRGGSLGLFDLSGNLTLTTRVSP